MSRRKKQGFKLENKHIVIIIAIIGLIVAFATRKKWLPSVKKKLGLKGVDPHYPQYPHHPALTAGYIG